MVLQVFQLVMPQIFHHIILAEVIDATVYMIDHPTTKVDKLMEFLPGPDFPTGGIIQGRDEIKKAYENWERARGCSFQD